MFVKWVFSEVKCNLEGTVSEDFRAYTRDGMIVLQKMGYAGPLSNIWILLTYVVKKDMLKG